MDLRDEILVLDDLLLKQVQTVFPDPLTMHERVGVRAFLVLGHACVEEYVEQAFLDHFKVVARALPRSGVPSSVSNLMYAIGLSSDKTKAPPYKSRTMVGMANAYARQYEAAVSDNHGIGTRYVQKLAEGLGLDWTRLDNALQSSLPDLDTLSAKRGEAGHTSPFSDKTIGTSEEFYPDDARTWVGAACSAAEDLRRYLAKALWSY